MDRFFNILLFLEIFKRQNASCITKGGRLNTLRILYKCLLGSYCRWKNLTKHKPWAILCFSCIGSLGFLTRIESYILCTSSLFLKAVDIMYCNIVSVRKYVPKQWRAENWVEGVEKWCYTEETLDFRVFEKFWSSKKFKKNCWKIRELRKILKLRKNLEKICEKLLKKSQKKF